MKKTVNISLDDFELALKDITNHSEKFDSIFSNSILSELKKMHDKYGVKFSCFCFSNNIMDISAVTGKFRNEFNSISHWLKFGFHGTDYNAFMNLITLDDFQEQYEKTIHAITAFAGESSLCKAVRLHGYCGSAKVMKALALKYDIQGVFCADDQRISYDLTPSENDIVNTDFI